MAIGRLSVKVGKKGKASKHAQYIFREGKYKKPNDSLEQLEHTEHGNMPAWAEHEPNYFWKMADEYERKNGSTYREHEIALPRELSKEQRLELVRDWIAQEIGDKHAYQFAIHNPKALDGDEQPHAHIMYSNRLIDGIERDPEQYFKRYNSKHPERGGARKTDTGKLQSVRKKELKQQRERFEILVNKHLEKAGHSERISMKSLKAQGVDREPINLSMVEIQRDDVKTAYKAELLARRELELAELDLALNVPNIRAELERQRETQDNEETLAIADEWITQQAYDGLSFLLKIREPKRKRTEDEQEQADRAIWIVNQVRDKKITDELRKQSLEYARSQQRAIRLQKEQEAQKVTQKLTRNDCSQAEVENEEGKIRRPRRRP